MRYGDSEGVEFLNYHGYKNCPDYPIGAVAKELEALIRQGKIAEKPATSTHIGRRFFEIVSAQNRSFFYDRCGCGISIRESIRIPMPASGSAKEVLGDYAFVLSAVRKRISGKRERDKLIVIPVG